MGVLNANEGSYSRYIVQDLHDPNAGSPEFQEMYRKFSKRILWIDDKVAPGAFQMNTAWYHSVPDRDPVFKEHVHEDDEIVGFFGSDPEDPYKLDADITFTINGEEYKVDRTTMFFIPGGLPHGQIRIKRVGTPVFHFSVVTGREYNGGAYKD